MDGGLLFRVNRVLMRKGLIVVYRSLVTGIEEKTAASSRESDHSSIVDSHSRPGRTQLRQAGVIHGDSTPSESVGSTVPGCIEAGRKRKVRTHMNISENFVGCQLELYPRSNGDLYVCGCGGSDTVSGNRLRDGWDSDRLRGDSTIDD